LQGHGGDLIEIEMRKVDGFGRKKKGEPFDLK
jgi:hypothetical protein